MMRFQAYALLLCVAGCGSAPHSGPDPVPAPPRPTVTIQVTDTVTGALLRSQTSDVLAGFPTMFTISQPGYVTRQAAIRGPAETVDLIPEAGFDLAFYRQLVRNGYEAPDALEPVRRLTAAPSIYLQTAGLSAATVAALEQAARTAVYEFSGHTMSVGSFETGESARPERAGWLTVDLVSELDNQQCGRALVGVSAGHIWLSTSMQCQTPSTGVDTSRILMHEAGHAMGFWHTNAPGALMSTGVSLPSEPSAAERYHAAIAYHRAPGNRDVDTDSLGPASLTRTVVD